MGELRIGPRSDDTMICSVEVRDRDGDSLRLYADYTDDTKVYGEVVGHVGEIQHSIDVGPLDLGDVVAMREWATEVLGATPAKEVATQLGAAALVAWVPIGLLLGASWGTVGRAAAIILVVTVVASATIGRIRR